MNKNILLAALLGLVTTLPAHADALSAKAALAHEAARLQNVIGYQSASHVSIYSFGAGAQSAPVSQFDINSTVERPNKLSLATTQATHLGVLLLADGNNVTVFNAPELKYIITPSGADRTSLIGSIEKALKVSLEQSQITQLNVSLTVPSMFLDGTIDLSVKAPNANLKDTASNLLYNGQRYL